MGKKPLYRYRTITPVLPTGGETDPMDLLHSLIRRTPFPWVITEDGLKLHICEDLFTYHQVKREYRFSDIVAKDRVLDIGANIGVFSLLAARRGARVLAVEPIRAKELRKNISLNHLPSIQVLECALGSGNSIEVSWQGETRTVPSLPLSELVRILGGCTFLKVDCEGGEWCIHPGELEEIPRIEMELHRKGRHERYYSFLERLRAHHQICYEPSAHPDMYGLVHAYRKNTDPSLKEDR